MDDDGAQARWAAACALAEEASAHASALADALGRLADALEVLAVPAAAVAADTARRVGEGVELAAVGVLATVITMREVDGSAPG